MVVRHAHVSTPNLQKIKTQCLKLSFNFLQIPRAHLHTAQGHLPDACSESFFSQSVYSVSVKQMVCNRLRLVCNLIVSLQMIFNYFYGRLLSFSYDFH